MYTSIATPPLPNYVVMRLLDGATREEGLVRFASISPSANPSAAARHRGEARLGAGRGVHMNVLYLALEFSGKNMSISKSRG